MPWSSFERPLWRGVLQLFEKSQPSATANPYPGDRYFAGTLYDNGTTVQHTLWNCDQVTDGPYLRYLRKLGGKWPELRYLADFTTISTVPARAPHLSSDDLVRRHGLVKVALLECIVDGTIVRRDFGSAEALEKALCELPSSQTTARLFVTEDLSTAMIELLGFHLDVDPRFFRQHLEDHTWYNVADNWAELPVLDSITKTQPFFTCRHFEAKMFESKQSVNIAKKECFQFNVLRRLDFQGQAKSGVDVWYHRSTRHIGLLRKQTSVWIRTRKGLDEIWTGLILVDPTLYEGTPLWSGYGSMESPPSVHDHRIFTSPPNSLFEKIITQITSISPDEKLLRVSEPDHIITAIFPVILGEILVSLEYTFTGLFQVECEIDQGRYRNLEDLDATYGRLQAWQRRLPFYTSWIITTIQGLTNYSQQHRHNQISQTNWTTVIDDFNDVLSRLKSFQQRIDRVMGAATAVIQIEESRRVVDESRNISRITYLTFFFIPMSFVSSFLSMNDSYNRGSKVYSTFFSVAPPLSFLFVLIAIYWFRIGKLVSSARRTWDRRFR